MNKESSNRPRWVLHHDELTLVSDFADLRPKQRPAVFCPACKRQVIMKLGKRVVHHFAHKADCDCVVNSPESALHLNTKVYIGKCLERADKLFVSLPCSGFPNDELECTSPSPYLLLSGWDEVRIECDFGTLRPDIGLFRQGALICAIEICATHPVPDEKIEIFEREGVVWLEVKASDTLFDGEAAWRPEKPLPLLRGTPLRQRPQWNCADCVEKKEQVEWGKRNYTEIRHEKAADFYFPSGKTYRELFRVWGRVENGELVELWLTRKELVKIHCPEVRDFYTRIDKQIGKREAAPIDGGSLQRLKESLQSYLSSRKERQGAIVDVPMGWKEYDPDEHYICSWKTTYEEDYEEENEPLLDTDDFPERYVWSKKKSKWFLPKRNEELRWDEPETVAQAKRLQKQSLEEWKRKKDEERKQNEKKVLDVQRVSKPPPFPKPDISGTNDSFFDHYSERKKARAKRNPQEKTKKKRFVPREGVCVFCSQKTSKWWFFDGSSNTCKCIPCQQKGLT